MLNMKNINLSEIIEFRHELHTYPELSEQEINTAARIVSFASKYAPDDIIQNIGGHDVAVVFKGKKPGPTIMIRADIDALPFAELNVLSYKSTHKGISHSCGHDGHTAIAAGLIPYYSSNKLDRGTLAILFQTAEETGKGAELVLKDKQFQKITPDYIFGLHNIPGYAKGSVIIKDGVFSSASKGIIIKLEGKSCHAAEPDKGLNPALAMSELINNLSSLPRSLSENGHLNMITIVHAKLGEDSFGTSPGQAVIMLTLRSENNNDMQLLNKFAIKSAETITEKHKLKLEISYAEEFSATENNTEAVEIVKSVAIAKNQGIMITDKAFPWSEDFGRFTENYKGAFFGIGAGINHAVLHDQYYDFPDDIIKHGINMFIGIVDHYLNNSEVDTKK